MGDVIIKKGLIFLIVLFSLVSFVKGADFSAQSGAVIELSYPDNGMFYTTNISSFTLSSFFSSPSTNLCGYSLRGEFKGYVNCSVQVPINMLETLIEGNYLILVNVSSLNSSGIAVAYAEDTHSFKVDGLAPRVKFDASVPEDNANLNHRDFNVSIEIEETYQDAVVFELYNDQSVLIDREVSKQTLYRESYNNLEDGTYVYQVKVNDTVGHTTLLQRTVTIDTTDPEVNFIENTLSDYAVKSQDYVYMKVNVIESHEAEIIFDLYDQFGNPVVGSPQVFTNPTRFVNWTGLNDGIYNYKVTVCDIVEHCAPTETRTILLDTTSPEVSLISPNNNKALEETTQHFVYNFIEENSVNCSFYLEGLLNNMQSIKGTDFGVSGIGNSFDVEGLEVGRHRWRVECVDLAGNLGNSTENKFTILAEQTFPNGITSTDLTNVPDISNVSDFFVGNPSYGSLQWIVPLDLSMGRNYANYINLSTKRIEVDSVGAPELNHPARIVMYGVTEKSPRILKNSAVCGSSECPIEYYNISNGTLVFTVTGFSVYTVDETPVNDGGVSASGSSGGSGGGSRSGVSTCKEMWECSDWSECSNGNRLRMCVDRAKCGSVYMKPIEKESCGAVETNTYTTEQPKTEESGNSGKDITGSVVADVEGGNWSGSKIIVLSVLGLIIAGYSFNKFRGRKEDNVLKKDPWGLNDL